MAASIQSNTRHFEVIVIGAGISGLACAARIFENKARKTGSVAVLEARDRIGGRINSVYLNGSRLDTGANWIHGVGTDEKPNPLMEILPHKRYRQLSGMVAFRPPVKKDDSILQSHADDIPGDGWVDLAASTERTTKADGPGKDLVIPSEHAAILMGSVWATIGELHEVSAETPAAEAKQTTMISVLKGSETLREAFEELPPEYHGALGGIPQFVESMEAAPLVTQSAEHPEESAGMSMLEYAIADFDGDQVFVQDGYIAVIEEVSKELVKTGAINLGVEVEHISWDSNPIEIQTSNGTYTADTVVCTIPLGVLKSRQTHTSSPKSSLFRPELPREKTEAISSLGFGTLDKIFLVYSHPWWTEEPYASILEKGISRQPFAMENSDAEEETDDDDDERAPDSIMGFTDELPGIEIHQDGTVSTGPRLLSFINLHSLCGFPVLSAFSSCANAAQIEKLSDSDAKELLHRTLTTWFGQEPPKPDAVHVTRWASDPYSLGSYSNMITGRSETKHRETFQSPLVNQHGAELRFAGEHTSRNHFATVHGALLSGWREADAILNRGSK